jgi:hypothetical protein
MAERDTRAPGKPEDPARRDDERSQGISNRETAAEEAGEREEFPPVQETPAPAQDAAGRTGDEAPGNTDGRQTSHKAGSRSIAQKEDETRYPDRSMPASRKVAGAFGREPAPEPDKLDTGDDE